MKNNIKLAKELLKIAKNLIADNKLEDIKKIYNQLTNSKKEMNKYFNNNTDKNEDEEYKKKLWKYIDNYQTIISAAPPFLFLERGRLPSSENIFFNNIADEILEEINNKKSIEEMQKEYQKLNNLYNDTEKIIFKKIQDLKEQNEY